MSTIFPPIEIFEITPNFENPLETIVDAAGGYTAPNWVKTVCPPEGGIYLYHEGLPFPRKGHVYPQAIAANNQVKKMTLAMLQPFVCKEMFIPMCVFLLLPGKISFLEKMLAHYCRLSDSIYRSVFPVPYLKDLHYKNCCRELRKFLNLFLVNIGISEDTATRTGKMVATMIEYEDMYQYVLEDLCSLTSKQLLMANPRKEVKKLIGAIVERSNTADNTLGGKFKTFLTVASWLLVLPKVKKAFKNALEQIDFSKLQLDDADIFYCLINGNEYKFLGKSLEERRQMLIDESERQFKNNLILNLEKNA